MQRILAIDDDEYFLKSIQNLLEYEGYETLVCSNPAQAEDCWRRNPVDCVLLDVKMPGVDGLEVLDKLLAQNKNLPVIMISGQSTITTAVEAIKKGAFDFIEKPVDAERLIITVKNAIKTNTLVSEKNALLAELEDQYRFVAASPSSVAILSQIETVAPTKAKVLITGETGTGKELVARLLHLKSDRASGPFVKINCAAIPGELLESELFGHKKGAFTGAYKDTLGKFQLADGGTLFLDEIGDMDMMLQAKLLHVLQDNEFMMLGSADAVKVNVRIVAATNQNLIDLIQQGRFREDLYHRINVVEIRIPPLRKRPEDIEMLARRFLFEFSETYNKRVLDFEPTALAALQQHNWPGNVRELKNLVEKLVIFARASKITFGDLRPHLEALAGEETAASAGTLREKLKEYERNVILNALAQSDGKVNEAAKLLGIDRSSLFKKRKMHGI